MLRVAAGAIAEASSAWQLEWTRGLILRSSAASETLRDRGAHISKKLAADYDSEQIAEALNEVYEAFSPADLGAPLAVIVQPLVGDGSVGHISNERRISKTINHWEWEQTEPPLESGRFNSQRNKAPDLRSPLIAKSKAQTINLFKSVGRWVTSLDLGPAHLEWAESKGRLWLLQLDFENESPDEGVDPASWFRASDSRATGVLPSKSPFQRIDLSRPTPRWNKIENARALASIHTGEFPALFSITGDAFLRSLRTRKDLWRDVQAITHGRAVCRTDCRDKKLRGLNLPRTHTVGPRLAISNMRRFLKRLRSKGVDPQDVCFILHKFIPAQACAWASADPASQLVRVDSLWGVPDGLQFLPHDTFEYDVRAKAETSARIRYKPRFIQECADGSWQDLRVRRLLARHRSITKADLKDVAAKTHAVACGLGKAVLIMWFCVIPEEIGLGRNLPWFRMDPPEKRILEQSVSPRRPKRHLRSISDLEELRTTLSSREVLVLDPEVELIREDEKFLSKVIELAQTHQVPVELSGSILSHAFYQLEKSGLSVILADEPTRKRIRRKRRYEKLVRDSIPQRIEYGGETVIQARLPRTQLRKALVAKLFEESNELLAARDPNEVREELADLFEVIRAIAMTTGVTWQEVERTADVKRGDRGGFETGAVLLQTSSPKVDAKPSPSSRMLSLQDLSRVVVTNGTASISFNALEHVPVICAHSLHAGSS